MKTTLGELKIKGQHIGSGTMFLIGPTGETLYMPLHSSNLYSKGMVQVGELAVQCNQCRLDKGASLMFIWHTNKNGKHVGLCSECHLGQSKELGHCHAYGPLECPVCRKAGL